MACAKRSRSSSRDSSNGEPMGHEPTGLPSHVSRWNLQILESLGIFYSNVALSEPSDVMEKMGKFNFPELDNNMNTVLIHLKECLAFNLDLEALIATLPVDMGTRLYIRPLLDAKEAILQHIKESRNSKGSLSSQLEFFALHTAQQFIGDIAYIIIRGRQPVGDTPAAAFTQMITTFTTMCFLYPKPGDIFKCKGQINGEEVGSVPDLRLKFGKNDEYDLLGTQLAALVSIAEIKRSKTECVPPPVKMSRSTCQAALDGKPPCLRQLGISLLGQHGGELLMDWKHSDFLPYMPGVIVAGTKVIFTLLEISIEHVMKLSQNLELDKSDNATIYYSEPLDIFVKMDRDKLMETFLRISMRSPLMKKMNEDSC